MEGEIFLAVSSEQKMSWRTLFHHQPVFGICLINHKAKKGTKRKEQKKIIKI